VKKLVEVELVVVELSPVKFWRVEEPYERRFPAVTDPKVELPAFNTVAKRLVELAVVVKKLVLVLLVVVELIPVKFCKVDEPVARRLVVVAKVKRAEVTVRRRVKGLKRKPESEVRVWEPLKKATWLATPPLAVSVPWQTVPIAKQPLVRESPLLKVEVALPVTLSAAVLMPPVKVEEETPVTVRMPVERLVEVAPVAKRSVKVPLLAKILVEVALPVVALPPTVSEAMVDEPRE
jgi:hypothetical protein